MKEALVYVLWGRGHKQEKWQIITPNRRQCEDSHSSEPFHPRLLAAHIRDTVSVSSNPHCRRGLVFNFVSFHFLRTPPIHLKLKPGTMSCQC